MVADCEQTRARILELLYGELAAPARAQIEAHVKTCPDCTAELAALESTRALARQTLAADAPPPRARAAILQAAAAALPARKPVSAPARPSLWERIRGKWTFPTFATVGAVAVFLLASRIFMEPEKTYQRGRQGVAPAVAPEVATPAEETQPAAPAPADLKREAEEPSADRAAPPAAPARHKPQPARRVPGGRASPGTPAKESRDDLLEGAVAAPETRAFAPPPPAARPQRKEEEQEERAAAASALDEDAIREAPSRAASGAAARAPSAAPAAKRAQAPAAAESPAVRADRLFAQRRWAEAAVAYRDLLRDAPRSPDSPRWRQRLAACEAAASALAAPPPP